MIYWALVRYAATGDYKRLDFRSEQERALCLVALGGAVRILEEGNVEDRP